MTDQDPHAHIETAEYQAHIRDVHAVEDQERGHDRQTLPLARAADTSLHKKHFKDQEGRDDRKLIMLSPYHNKARETVHVGSHCLCSLIKTEHGEIKVAADAGAENFRHIDPDHQIGHAFRSYDRSQKVNDHERRIRHIQHIEVNTETVICSPEGKIAGLKLPDKHGIQRQILLRSIGSDIIECQNSVPEDIFPEYEHASCSCHEG